MIPKKIHYCWFGKKELPAKAVRCINSWKSTALIMKLLNGTRTTMMFIKIHILLMLMTIKNLLF